MYDGLYMPIAIMITLLCGIALIPLVSFGHYNWIAPLTIIPFLLLNIFDMVEVDFNKRLYREGIIFFGFRFGEWKKVLDFEYVSIIGQSLKSVSNTNPGMFKPLMISSNTTVTYYGTYKIRLFQTYKRKLNIKEVNSSKKGLKFGKALAKGFDVKLLDATQKPPVFVDLT